MNGSKLRTMYTGIKHMIGITGLFLTKKKHRNSNPKALQRTKSTPYSPPSFYNIIQPANHLKKPTQAKLFLKDKLQLGDKKKYVANSARVYYTKL